MHHAKQLDDVGKAVLQQYHGLNGAWTAPMASAAHRQLPNDHQTKNVTRAGAQATFSVSAALESRAQLLLIPHVSTIPPELDFGSSEHFLINAPCFIE